MAKSEKKKTVSKKINPNGALKVPGTNVSMLSGLEPLLIPISDVSPDPANPRRVKDLGALVGSLKRFGLRKPIVANGRNNIIEAGHQTHHAMTELGATHIPVLWADDDGLTATAFNIADNRTGEIVAEWDDEILAKLLSELNDEDCIDDIGFSQQQVEGLISSFVDHEIKDDDDLPATPFDDDDEGGGGTQYTFLEAIDFGADCILASDWYAGPRSEMKPGVHYHQVGNVKELQGAIDKVRHGGPVLQCAAKDILVSHDAEQIARQYIELL